MEHLDMNEQHGHHFYKAGDAEVRQWFEDQWRAWPRRVDEDSTTNISFLYGGMLRYREENEGRDPQVSHALAQIFSIHDEFIKRRKEKVK